MVKIENNDSVDQEYRNGDPVVTNLIGETIKIKYFDKEIDKIEKISNGDWIDLRSAETGVLRTDASPTGARSPRGCR